MTSKTSELPVVTPFELTLPKILLGRDCRLRYIPIENSVSEATRSKLVDAITEVEEKGYMFQRLSTVSPINEGYGLLKDILKKEFPNLSEEELAHTCRNYQLWRFFSDNSVEQEEWQEVLDRLLGQIGQLAGKMSGEN